MDNLPIESAESTRLAKAAMTRRFYTRSVVKGEITLPAVPSMIDEYVTMCAGLFAGVGRKFSDEELAHLRAVLQGQLAEAYAASQRSTIVISYNAPMGPTLHYQVRAQWRTVAQEYENWIPPVSRRSSVPNQTHVCGRWPTKQPILRRIGCSKLAPEPGVTPWRWHGADTRSTWWR
ncbi:Hypothetical protein ERS031513_00184 [Mycobacterium tuberculosis]|nr:Hypothetical protein ERS031513_00184 [Mycobacterium tuberculosis]